MKPVNKIKINFAYEGLIFDGKGKKMNVGIPNLFPYSKTHLKLFPSYSPFYNKDLKELEEEFQLSFPYDLSEEDMKPSWFDLTSNSFIYHNGYEGGSEVNTVEYFYKKRKNFVYPISVFSLDFYNESPPLLPPLVIKACLEGLAKIIILQLTEGYIYSYKEFKFLNDFSTINFLSSNNFYIFSGNLILEKNLEKYTDLSKDRYKILPSYHFEDSPWFLEEDKYIPRARIKMWEHFEDILHYNRERDYDQYFLCYQRRNRDFRIWLFSQIQLNKTLAPLTSISLGAGESEDEITTVKTYLEHVAIQKNRPQKEIEHVFDLDLEISYQFDEVNLKENQAHSLDIGMHNSHFLSIVSETLVKKDTIFFSEKTFKPIYMLQPFILVGSQYQLKKLKEMGYKTFDKYWSEEYDNCEHYMDRIDKIQEVLEYISTWSLEKCQEVYLSMEDILVHNFHQLIKLDRYYNTLREIDCGE